MGAMRTVYFLVKHALPHTTLYSQLLDFCSFQGCDYLSSLNVGGNAHYRSEQIIQEFLTELDAQTSSTILEQLQRSPYIALMADETTDISVSNELILYVQYIIPSATPEKCVRSVFLNITELQDGKAATITEVILEILARLNIPIQTVMGFGSDGASVMIGRRAGVATLLKQSNPELIAIYCVAHRLALAVAQAGDAVPYVKIFKTVLHNLYSFYDNSPVRTAGLSAIQSILHDPSFKQAKGHRWLSHEGACQTLRRTLQSIYVSLQREAAERNEPMADGLCRQMSKFNFVATLYLLCDVLPHICRLSRVFQREAIDLTELNRLVHTTLGVIQPLMQSSDPDGHLAKVGEDIDEQLSTYITPLTQSQRDSFLNQIQKPFIQNLCDNLQQRFPDVELLDAFSIFDPSKLPTTYDVAVHTRYGVKKLEIWQIISLS